MRGVHHADDDDDDDDDDGDDGDDGDDDHESKRVLMADVEFRAKPTECAVYLSLFF